MNKQPRMGIIISHPTPKETIEAIIQADQAGVDTVWSISGGIAPDLLTYYAAASVQTKHINFGTSIIPILPRHPAVMVAQALVLENLAPGRLRLGIGPSHKYPMEQMLGLDFAHPQKKLQEYVSILRQALWEGKLDFSGDYYALHRLALPPLITPPRTPILISALREKAFTLAGEIADGAISWMCPVDYLVKTAKPAMQQGARQKKRKTPPLIAHVPVAFSSDKDKVLPAAHEQLGRYGKMPYYAQMFRDAGFAVGPNGELSDELIHELVVSGTAAQIQERLAAIASRGIEELLILPVIVDDKSKEEKALFQLIGYTH